MGARAMVGLIFHMVDATASRKTKAQNISSSFQYIILLSKDDKSVLFDLIDRCLFADADYDYRELPSLIANGKGENLVVIHD